MLKPDTKHSEYSAALDRWAKCRDAVSGEDAVHAGAEKYLPKLKEQSAEDYKAYVMRTPFYNATARTIDGLVGMLFRKDPVVEAPTALDNIIADMTLANADLNELAEVISREVVSVGRVGVLVEYPQVAEKPATLAQASAQNLRPYCTTYKAETILNWRMERVNNAMQPTMITLLEAVTEWPNAYESKEVPQIRALLLENGQYIQRIYREDKKEWNQVGADIVPLMNNAPLGYIPFVFFGASFNGASVQKSPIYDLVTLNLSHYRTTADLEHGAHFTGLPTAVISGYQVSEKEKLAIGASNAWVFPDPQAKASYLEFTGQGLGALSDRLLEKEKGMAAIGARMLAPEKQSAEASKTVQMRHSGEGAVLASIANMISSGLTRVLQIMAKWSSIDAEASIELNRDFVDNTLTAQDVAGLVASWQAGAISYETLFWNLQQGELIPAERTLKEEQGSLEVAAPALGMVGNGNGE